MFGTLLKESDDVAFTKGAEVDIKVSSLLRIQEAEGLEKHRDLAQLFYVVRTFLEDWCRGNIKCKWRAHKEIIYPPEESSEEVLRFAFVSRKEAVRFKLTWGGV